MNPLPDHIRQSTSLQKRSISLYGHRTSIALEPEFWNVLDIMAQDSHNSLAALVARIDTNRAPNHGLASALRVTALRYVAQQSSFPLPTPHDTSAEAQGG